MKLRQLVMEKAIVPGLKSSKRDECIGELLDALMKGGAFKPAQRDDFLKAVIKREKKGSTGFGHGVAVPHVKTLEVKKCVAAIGLHHAGGGHHAHTCIRQHLTRGGIAHDTGDGPELR